MPAKIEYVKAEKGNDLLANVLGKHVILMERECSCYGGGQFNAVRMVLQRWSV